jgi:hypothetical protein
VKLVDLVEFVTELRSSAGCASVVELVDLVELVTELRSTAGCASVVDLVEFVELVTELCSSAVCAMRLADGYVSISARKPITRSIVE